MNRTPQLIVVTLMPPQGTTGVQNHFNQILKAAVGLGYQTSIAHPFDFNHLARKAVGLITRLLRPISKEYVELWVYCAHYQILKHKLRRTLAAIKGPVILYSQAPLSAKAALAARTDKKSQRVAAVIHFNISEADEYLMKGITKHNSCLNSALVNTKKDTLPKIDKLFFVSQFMQSIVQNRLLVTKNNPNVVIPNFIDDLAGTSPTADLKGDIISVDTLEPRKNQSFILKVLATCKARGYVYRLTIIGSGQDRDKLEHSAHELGLAEQVTFLGFKTNAADYMASHRVFAHSSIIEAMGIALIEVLSYSLPILAAPVGGIPEVLTDGKKGFY
jgi:glycosyltransferase involved in cell wall biosynthesis